MRFTRKFVRQIFSQKHGWVVNGVGVRFVDHAGFILNPSPNQLQ